MPVGHLARPPDHHLVRINRHVFRELLIAHDPQPPLGVHRHPERHQIAALRIEIIVRPDDRRERARSHVQRIHAAILCQHIDRRFTTREPRQNSGRPRHLAQCETRRRLRQRSILRRFHQLSIRRKSRLRPPRRDLLHRKSARLIAPRIGHVSQHCPPPAHRRASARASHCGTLGSKP